MSKEIHFYESVKVIPDDVRVLHDWQSTYDAIEEMYLDNIHTTQMCLMSTSLIVKGYRIFVHQQNGVVYELHLRDKEHQDDYAVRVSQNMFGMWRSNVFRILKTVEEYVKTTQTWNYEGLQYDIDGVVFENAKDIPDDIEAKTVDTYNFKADCKMIALTTKTD